MYNAGYEFRFGTMLFLRSSCFLMYNAGYEFRLGTMLFLPGLCFFHAFLFSVFGNL
ncbi:hypothetical protein JCM6292_2624 [Bacteroides pyogenes JCM 6292]|uniref:Uncharacterized protein n=2 Tax=Bacteroides pyogenes TaxID=310300 RepID=W4PKN1_9BACE|nr:hypothetical protein JCM6292_2624 [Bacteroides pyogenes JCM 6292]GAE19669.1 hypothetical protein JCM6294_2750 [Bacteroides pyogenes DSM 20611 = JCM 6294]